MAGLVRSLEVSELQAFCAAVDLGSLGRAARALHISQPAVSKRMRELEAVAGTRLLDRSPRGIVPTPAGSKLYAEARRLLAQAERVEEVVLGLAGEHVPVRLAVSHTIAEFVLPGPLVEYEQRHAQHLSLELVIANSIVVRDLVRDGSADFGIAAEEPGPVATGLEQLDLCDDEVLVAVTPDHPWAELAEIPVDQLVATPMVMRDPSANTRRVVEAALAARGLELAPPLAEVGSTSAAKAAALSERAPVLLSRLALQGQGERLVARGVSGIRFGRRFVVLFAARSALRASARSLLDHLVISCSYEPQR